MTLVALFTCKMGNHASTSIEKRTLVITKRFPKHFYLPWSTWQNLLKSCLIPNEPSARDARMARRRPRSYLDHEKSAKYVSKNSRFFFLISRKCSKYLKNIWLHFINITVKTQKNSRLSKMATQISAILLNISHMAHIIMENIAESDYNRPICEDLFEFLSLKCPCPNEHWSSFLEKTWFQYFFRNKILNITIFS